MPTVAELLKDLTDDTITLISEQVAEGGPITGTLEWRFKKLDQLGALRADTIKIIAKYQPDVEAAIYEQLKANGIISAKRCDDMARFAAARGADVATLPYAAVDPQILKIIDSYYATAASEANLAMASLLDGATDAYRQTLDRAVAANLSGIRTAQAAARSAVSEWAKAGIPSLIDTAGRNWSVESYTNMIMRTVSRRVTTDVQFTRTTQYGTDLVEVSSHADARPKCASDQGQVYSLSGLNKNYPAFRNTSYGEPDGLFGINCRHEMYPYWEGASIQRFNEYPQGQTATKYGESQQQRSYESAIRKTKHEIYGMDGLGDEVGTRRAKNKLEDQNRALTQFLEDTGRKRRTNREIIYTGVI